MLRLLGLKFNFIKFQWTIKCKSIFLFPLNLHSKHQHKIVHMTVQPHCLLKQAERLWDRGTLNSYTVWPAHWLRHRTKAWLKISGVKSSYDYKQQRTLDNMVTTRLFSGCTTCPLPLYILQPVRHNCTAAVLPSDHDT